MLDSFPAGSLPPGEEDPEGYEPALAAALCQHPREVAEDCADPKMGVVQECLARKALTAGRINDWCVRHGKSLRDFMERENERAHQEYLAAKAAREAAHENSLAPEERRAVIERFRARLGPNFGLKHMDMVDIARAGARGMTVEEMEQAQREEDHQRQEARAARERDYNQRSMLAEYAAKDLEPVLDKGGRVLPISFVRTINPALLRPAPSGESEDPSPEGAGSDGEAR